MGLWGGKGGYQLYLGGKSVNGQEKYSSAYLTETYVCFGWSSRIQQDRRPLYVTALR